MISRGTSRDAACGLFMYVVSSNLALTTSVQVLVCRKDCTDEEILGRKELGDSVVGVVMRGQVDRTSMHSIVTILDARHARRRRTLLSQSFGTGTW
jgi:hypothetical protein